MVHACSGVRTCGSSHTELQDPCFPALSSSGFSHTPQPLFSGPQKTLFPGSSGQKAGFLSEFQLLMFSTAVQLYKWGPPLGQSHEIRGENGEHPYMTFQSFDSPSQSACFCLLCGVLRYLLFVFTFLVVISKRDGLEWFYSTFANIRDPLPTSNFILHHCPVTLL